MFSIFALTWTLSLWQVWICIGQINIDYIRHWRMVFNVSNTFRYLEIKLFLVDLVVLLLYWFESVIYFLRSAVLEFLVQFRKHGSWWNTNRLAFDVLVWIYHWFFTPLCFNCFFCRLTLSFVHELLHVELRLGLITTFRFFHLPLD